MPRLLLYLFEIVRIIPSLDRLGTDMSAVKPYFRRIILDTEPNVGEVNATNRHSDWADVVRQLPSSAGEFHIGCVGAPLFGTVFARLSAVETVITRLEVGYKLDAEDFAWITDGRLDRLGLSNLHTLVIFGSHPFGGCENDRPFEKQEKRTVKRGGDALTEIWKRCSNTT